MSGRLNSHSTIYGDYIERQVSDLAKRGGGIFNFKEIASWLELSPTHNLRKRLRTLEAQEFLTISMAAIGDCSWCLVYSIPDKRKPVIHTDDIPF